VVLDQLGTEAHALSSDIVRAEAALHDVLDRLSFLPAGVAADLQRLDLVRQTLDDFSRLLHVCAKVAPAGATLACGLLRAETRLNDLAVRLTGGSLVSRVGEDPDLDLF
jgi:hypothetical protein